MYLCSEELVELYIHSLIWLSSLHRDKFSCKVQNLKYIVHKVHMKLRKFTLFPISSVNNSSFNLASLYWDVILRNVVIKINIEVRDKI